MKLNYILLMMFSLLSGFAYASKNMEDRDLRTELHQRMALAHETAIQCYRSGVSIESCDSSFHSNCKVLGTNSNCSSRIRINSNAEAHNKQGD